MQSSPPVRRSERPQSPDSHYSIDLAALDTDSRSGASSPQLPTQHVDHILSEDIDGPSDFTQNLEKWMRGTGTFNSRNGTVKSGLHLLQAQNQTAASAGAILTTGQSTGGGEETRSASRHTPSGSPPKESVYPSSRSRLHSPRGSPEWDPYVEDSTPKPPPHKHLLQPTVEDYHSELTPARAFSTHMRPNSAPPKTVDGETEQGEQESEPSTPGRPSSETISPVRSPIFQRPFPRQFSSQSEEASFQQQLRELRDRCQQLEHVNKALSSAIEEERRLRQQEGEKHELALADSQKRERHLAEKYKKTALDKDDHQRAFVILQQQIRNSQGGLERSKQDHVREMNALKQRLDQEKKEHVQELEAMEQDLMLAGQSRDVAEEAMRAAQDDLAKYRKNHEESSQRDTDLHAQIEELQRQLGISASELERMQLMKKGADEMADSLRAELSLTRQTQSEEITRLTGDHRRAVDIAGDLEVQLEEVRKQQLERDTAQEVEVQRLQDDSGKTVPAGTQNVEALREELDSKHAELNTAIFERDALQDDLDAMRVEMSDTTSKLSAAQEDLSKAQLALETANNDLQDANSELFNVRLDLCSKEAVANAFDAKVTTTLQRRETFWREKVKALESKNELMGKALMRQWGREECGPPTIINGVEYQPYKFMYGRNGETTKLSSAPPEEDEENKVMPKKPVRRRATASAKAEARARMRAKDLADSVLRKSQEKHV